MQKGSRFSCEPVFMRPVLSLRQFVWRILGVLAVTACWLEVSAELAGGANASPMITVSGHVQFGEQRAKMTHLYFSRKASEEGPVLALFFSDQPLARGLLDDRQKLAGLAKRKAFIGLYVQLDDSGSIPMTDLYHDDGSFSGPWRFEAADGKNSTSSGRIATEGEQDFFGKSFAVDVTFKIGSTAVETWQGSPFYEAKPTGLAVAQAEGWMEQGSNRTKLLHALVVSETDLFGDAGERKLFLTTVPPGDEMLRAGMGPEQGLHKAGVIFLRVTLDANNEIQSVMVPSNDGNPVNFTSSQWNIELAGEAVETMDGRVQLLGAKDDDSDFPRFDVRFHAANQRIGAANPVTAGNGKPVPKDGGEPGKAYRDFATALKKAKSVEEILPLRIESMKAMINEVPPEHRAGMLEFLKQEAQTPYKIVGGFSNEEDATLWLEAQQGGEKIEGRVNLHREGGTWKLGVEAFRSRAQ